MTINEYEAEELISELKKYIIDLETLSGYLSEELNKHVGRVPKKIYNLHADIGAKRMYIDQFITERVEVEPDQNH